MSQQGGNMQRSSNGLSSQAARRRSHIIVKVGYYGGVTVDGQAVDNDDNGYITFIKAPSTRISGGTYSSSCSWKVNDDVAHTLRYIVPTSDGIIYKFSRPANRQPEPEPAFSEVD